MRRVAGAVLMAVSLLLIVATVTGLPRPVEAADAQGRGGEYHLTEAGQGTDGSPLALAYEHLEEVMDEYSQALDVYSDVGAGGNHFVNLAMMGAGSVVSGTFTRTVHSGASAISTTFVPTNGDSWGGWYLQNGVLISGDTKPADNWGDHPEAGLDLRGATTLSFWARGAHGGEQVEFLAFGVGREAESGEPVMPFPDWEEKVTPCGQSLTPCPIALGTTWQQYSIDLTGLDLRYVLGGFGWVSKGSWNSEQPATFYIDDIRYDLDRPASLRLLRSYQTISSSLEFDTILRNVAFSYDNALALIAFTADGDSERAAILADSFVYALEHDRYYDDRLRNAYQAGDLIIQPGWTPNDRVDTARMPGWWDEPMETWYEDEEFVGSGTGNTAWVMIALISYYERYGGAQYLSAAIRLGDWIEEHARDDGGAGGYTGGYDHWEPDPTALTWHSTEHNIDLYVAFERLHQITGVYTWYERSQHARALVESMWDEPSGCYWTGTLTDGVTVNTSTVPLDAQVWSFLAFGPNTRTLRAIQCAEANHTATWDGYDGFDFNDDRDMPWPEGTAQMVVAYWQLGESIAATYYRDELREIQSTANNGDGKGIVAAPADELTTGFDWLYCNRLHVGATAWFIFGERWYNPFWGTTYAPYQTQLPLVLRSCGP
jgi:hypothetical protein